MKKNQKSIRDGIEDFLCPFTDMYITQGSNMKPSHMGIMANDVRGYSKGVRYPYYAPCKLKCIKIYKDSGQVMWQSVNKVRFANGRVDYATIMTAHDDSMDAKVGQIVEQGSQLGNMGAKGNASGVHCHIQISQSNDTSWIKNNYGIYHFNNEYDLDDCYFTDDTNIIEGMGGNWKTTTDIEINKQYINLDSNIEKWRFYNINDIPVKKNSIGVLKPKKFGGLSYEIKEYRDNNTTVVIDTNDYSLVKIYIYDTASTITNTPLYKSGKY